MNINIIAVLYLLFSHWVADFLFQTTYMGTMKSKSNKVLLQHVSVYTFVMCCLMTMDLTLTGLDILIFAGVTFTFHTIQDYCTSRLTSYQFSQSKYNGVTGAFTIIGLDQFLHFCQLFLTYYFLTKPI